MGGSAGGQCMESVFALPRESDRDGGRKERRAKEPQWQPCSSGGGGRRKGERALNKDTSPFGPLSAGPAFADWTPPAKQDAADCFIKLLGVCGGQRRRESVPLPRALLSDAHKHTSGQVRRDACTKHTWLNFQRPDFPSKETVPACSCPLDRMWVWRRCFELTSAVNNRGGRKQQPGGRVKRSYALTAAHRFVCVCVLGANM